MVQNTILNNDHELVACVASTSPIVYCGQLCDNGLVIDKIINSKKFKMGKPVSFTDLLMGC